MSTSMHSITVPPILLALGNFVQILTKAQANLQERNIDASVLLSTRLYPDMFPFVRQVQIAADIARRGAIKLAGQSPSSLEDTEQSFPELIARLERSIQDISALDAAAFEGADTREVEAPAGKGKTVNLPGRSYLMAFVLPNLHFHMSTAYMILRQSGVPLGKRDYLGQPSSRAAL